MGLEGSGGEVSGEMPVRTPAAPFRDAARTVTAGSLRVLLGELRRAAAVVDGVRRHQLASAELFERAEAGAGALRLRAEGGSEERAARRGEVQGRALAEARALEAAGHAVRIYARWEPGADADELLLGIDERAAPAPRRR